MHVSSSISTKHLNASARLQNQVHVRVYKVYDKDDYCENKKRTACDKKRKNALLQITSRLRYIFTRNSIPGYTID